MGELADRPPTRLLIHHGPDAPRWLFPGRVPGQPIDNHSLTNRLNRHRISARPARNGALMALAADLPANIIADLLRACTSTLHSDGSDTPDVIGPNTSLREPPNRTRWLRAGASVTVFATWTGLLIGRRRDRIFSAAL